ncbi:hypothetical protein [Brachybacterium massiliense]|uniref:hypothetical protein n=1 Tax=Brachybacterium massiliense TaxID=1755098 RepID=UPI0011227FF1|nr:hypothetical protein [Brachybacterium massiliense]
MDLSTIPMPESRAGLTITTHTEALPTAPSWATGIVHADRSGRTTAQCSVCLRTATGTAFAVVLVGHWDFSPDPDESGHTAYRRCPECRAAHRHPAEQLDMLTYLEGLTS